MSVVTLSKVASIQRAVRRALPPELAGRLQRMVGFRNVAVHRDRDLDPGILASVIARDLDDLLEFSERVARIE